MDGDGCHWKQGKRSMAVVCGKRPSVSYVAVRSADSSVEGVDLFRSQRSGERKADK